MGVKAERVGVVGDRVRREADRVDVMADGAGV